MGGLFAAAVEFMAVVVDISAHEAGLFLDGRVFRHVTGERVERVVVVVGPFGEVVCEFEAWQVGGGVLEVDDHELFVLVGGLEERGFLVVGADAEDVAVLCLGTCQN